MAGCGGTPQSYIDRGNRFADTGKYADAGIQYEKAIQKDGNSGEAHYRLGLLDIRRNQPLAAYRDLKRASELMGDNKEVLFKLGEVALSVYNGEPTHPQTFYDDAAAASRRLLSDKPDGYDGNLLAGAIALIDKKPADAVADLRKAVAAKPGDPDAQLGLARALVSNDRAADGIAVAQGLVASDKTYGPAYDFLFQQFQSAGKKEDAENVLRLKVANNPKESSGIIELARYYASLQKPPEVDATIAKLTNNPADFPDGRLYAGDFYVSVGKPDLALLQFQAGLASAKSNRDTYRKRIVPILASQKKWSEVYQQLAAVLKDKSDDEEATLMRALAWVDEGKPENMDRAIAVFQEQSKKRPKEPGLYFQAGNAYLRKGDEGAAQHEWTLADQANAEYLPSRYALAQSYLAQGKAPDALQISEQITAVAPRNAEASLLHATCLTAAGQYQRARNELDRLTTQFPASPQVRFRLAVLDIAEHRYKDAENIFRQLGGNDSKDPQVLAGMAEALVGDNQGPQAIQLLEEELKRSPDSPVLREVLARIAAASGKYEVVVDQYRQIAAASPGSTPVQLSLASAYNAKGDPASAQAVLQKVVQADPKSVPASLMLAQALIATGHVEEAKARYRKLLEIDPNNANALNDLAYLMADSGENLDQALTYAQKGLRYATDPALKTSLSDTLGWIFVKKNMTDAALQTFQSLVRTNPSNATFHYHFGTALYQKGDKRQARVELEAALAAKPSTSDEPRIKELLARL